MNNAEAEQKEKEQRKIEDALETANNVMHVQMGPELRKILQKCAEEADARSNNLAG